LNKLFQRINIIVSINPEIIMAILCNITGICTTSKVISIGMIISIVVLGSLIGLATIITVIIIISILCKKKKQQPVVWVPSPIYHTATDYNQAMNMDFYPPYDQSFGFNVPPPAYQQENIPVVSSEKVEV
jgi:hypothetical protein